MTPERAAEIASRIRADYAISMGAKEAIKQAILKACAEQRESDAKIAQRYYDEYGYPVGLVVKAIRTAE